MPTPSDTHGAPHGDPPRLRVLQVARVPTQSSGDPDWLIESLWAYQAVGVLGGSPKSCKTFLALEMALAVATGSPCLGQFRVTTPGPVLVFAAEDAPLKVRARLDGLAQARGVDFNTLPVFLILSEQLRLDLPRDQTRLVDAIQTHRPRLLVLDPFVRLHRLQENSAQEISALLADLRALQRRFQLAVLLVHHVRKTNGLASGQDLRGSGDLWAWGDSFLYLQRYHEQLRLTVEHRAARAPDPFTLSLHDDDPVHLQVDDDAPPPASPRGTAPGRDALAQQVVSALRDHDAPLTQEQLRARLKVRNQSLTAVLRQLCQAGSVVRTPHGWRLSA